jgi:predicted nucleic acid-binding Zn ribbon protein
MEDRGRNVEAVKPGRPERVGGLVSTLLERLAITERVDRAGAIAEWDDVVGEHIAGVARPLRVRDRTLFVEVKSAAWLMELTMMRRELLRRLNANRRRGRIEKIVFVQAGGGTDAHKRKGGGQA